MRNKHPKYNDVEYHKAILDEVIEIECLDRWIDELEDAGCMAPKGMLSKLIILKNKINEIR